MRAGKLNKKIVLERSTETQAASGRHTETWAVLARVWAAVTPLTGGERKQAEQVQSDATRRVEIRRYEGLTPKDRALLPVACTLLNGARTAGQTSIVVDDVAGVSGTQAVYAQCETELMLITAGHGTTTLTVTRGADGTTPASHADNTPFVILAVLEIREIQEPAPARQLLLCSSRAD